MPFLAGTEGPSPLDTEPVVLHKSNSEDDVGNSSIAPFEEDVLMDQPVLDYINEMLMDEGMEDLMCMQKDCITYQAIVNGFYEIIGEHWPDSSVDSSEDLRASCYSSQPRLQADNTNEHNEYNLIHQVLNSSPFTPLLASSTSSQSSFPLEIKAGDSSYLHTAKAVGPEQHVLQMEAPANHVSLNYAGLEDVIRVSNWVQLDKGNFALEDDDAAAGSNAHSNRPGGQQQQVDGRVQPIAYHDRSLASSVDGDISFVKNKDLHVEEEYANLYIEESSPRDLAREDHTKSSINSGSNSSKNRSSTVNSNKDKGNSNSHDQNGGLGLVNLRELLMSCAQAVAVGNTRRANDVLEELRRHGASPNGSGLHRLAHYFSKALEARMSGTGGHLYTASNNMPSAAKLLKAIKRVYEVCPYATILHYFANQSILKAAEGASRLHIVDYGISYGLQWPYLINALADRKGGPPLLVITGIDFPQPRDWRTSAERLEDIGRRLAEYARTYKVPFKYHARAATKWEDVEPPILRPRQGEVLVVNCFGRLRNIPDESVDVASSARQKLLSRMRSLNPKLLVIAVFSAGYNTPFFVSRFQEALYFFSSIFDMMHTTWDDSPERMIMERDCMYRDILNVVACEGVERVERAETYRQWQTRIQRAGFKQLPIIPTILSRSRSHVKSYYHKHFNVDDLNRWMLVGWKGRTTAAISAWKPIPT